ncbi:tRNA A37 threonylcarbamoyladenosine synthetase subunit TsaC/SUA5/YrdC [Thermocatellispora tengchongensis]|uniref:tRNA A37 threonylcarbamoyladenosine synthetase subunit TsaC/SUA5/YrdC n=1 Tax=Thermocatellispora tengchongensis TaxID=1073253 RepID=A0A840P580_9ACTN|nr:tRNA A37 threonylcarbamoyladenosine synthetase subunit TsaC/SUA5/YrdC [Thermocatellispora tengchongensis]
MPRHALTLRFMRGLGPLAPGSANRFNDVA